MLDGSLQSLQDNVCMQSIAWDWHVAPANGVDHSLFCCCRHPLVPALPAELAAPSRVLCQHSPLFSSQTPPSAAT
jgi:hypothetical protein